VLRIPNATLRFRPNLSDSELAQAYKRAGEEKYLAFCQIPRRARRLHGGAMSGRPAAGAGREGKPWALLPLPGETAPRAAALQPQL